MVMMSNLEVKNRESVGKGKSRALRREGRIPGVKWAKSFCMGEHEIVLESGQPTPTRTLKEHKEAKRSRAGRGAGDFEQFTGLQLTTAEFEDILDAVARVDDLMGRDSLAQTILPDPNNLPASPPTPSTDEEALYGYSAASPY